MGAPVLCTENLHRQFVLPRESLFRTPETVYALNGVSLTIEFGRSLGVVGESGCGKSTLARLCMFLDKPTSGRVEVLGQDLSALSPSELRQARSRFQMVFQDPYGSLDPRHTVRRIVGETLDASPAANGATIGRRRLLRLLTPLACGRTIWINILTSFRVGRDNESLSPERW